MFMHQNVANVAGSCNSNGCSPVFYFFLGAVKTFRQPFKMVDRAQQCPVCGCRTVGLMVIKALRQPLIMVFCLQHRAIGGCRPVGLMIVNTLRQILKPAIRVQNQAVGASDFLSRDPDIVAFFLLQQTATANIIKRK